MIRYTGNTKPYRYTALPVIYLRFSSIGSIKNRYFVHLCNFIISMAKKNDTVEPRINDGLSRREALRALALGGFGAAAFAALPLGNDAQAEQANTFDMRTEMLRYSEDPHHRGVGIFINLQENAPMTGDQIGHWLQNYFASQKPPIAASFRVNQSRGTATDITFYMRGYDFTINVGDLQGELGNLLAHHRDVWPTGQATLSSLDQ